jgi:hypothetical protein
MYDECANKSAPKPPRCVACARPMQLVRRTPRFGGLPDLYTFQCEGCGEQHIEEGEATDRSAHLGAFRVA